MVRRLSNLPYEQRLRKLDLPSLKFRRHFGDMVQIYKHLHFCDKDTTVGKFIRRVCPSRIHDYELIPNFADDRFRGVQTKLFYYRCVTAWNQLPKETVNATSIKMFKEELTKAWMEHPLRYESRSL
ncbi:uncharacterized protein [Clytia hemisphaerica]|uniref:uncharacterized protein n=1 Tax=Clytia hemisphaerica TaxID=252671 RepID=UPI0034D4C00F